MRTLYAFWSDEMGLVVSAETVAVGTVGVLGAVTALDTASTAVNDELTDIARALRSFDQSYSVQGFSCCRSWTATSSFQQEDVAVLLGDPVHDPDSSHESGDATDGKRNDSTSRTDSSVKSSPANENRAGDGLPNRRL